MVQDSVPRVGSPKRVALTLFPQVEDVSSAHAHATKSAGATSLEVCLPALLGRWKLPKHNGVQLCSLAALAAYIVSCRLHRGSTQHAQPPSRHPNRLLATARSPTAV